MLDAVLLLCLLASLFQLTQHEIGPILLHRPIAAGPLLGAAVGIPDAGFFLGACLEWVWLDRIPAGGIRAPAASVGVTAGLIALLVIDAKGPGGFPLLAYMPFALIMACLYTVLYIPLDGGLRRLWNYSSEKVLLALEHGSLHELRLYAPTVLLLRWLVVALGLASAAIVTLLLGDWLYDPTGPEAMIAWPWLIAAAFCAFVARRRQPLEAMLALALFAAGVWWGGRQ